ncbi:MAG: LysM peptidoglycan-binding domain-containing protein [Rheinheimera sp.]|nr:LysM peptidoglycan-binding domain-containing protein [Rheinheimera sp.]
MFKPRLMLLVILLLSGCAQLAQHPTEVSTAEPSAAGEPESTAQADAHVLPMSPLDPALQQNELEALSDLWQRIRSQMHIPVPARADVQREIAFYASKQKFFNEVSARAEPYLYFIVSELEKRRMPIELALLPIVESAYNPAAQGNGPAGLWQMVPQTARNFGLTVQSGYDGRKDAFSSTLAVLDYLQHLHDTLGNDWLNAVAAYNTGEGRIMAAVARNKARGKATDYWSLQIPARFVQTMPKWLAMIQLIKTPEDYQLKLPVIANKPAVGITRIAGAVQLQQAADLAGISLGRLKTLNPGFRLAMTPHGKDFPLLLPLSAIDDFERQQHLLKKVTVVSAAEALKSGKRSYIVKSGDNLGTIAAKADTSVKTLRQLNRLKSDQLKVGQSLQLPAVKSPGQNVARASRKAQTYQVKAGESLWTIAQKLRIDSEELRLFNQLKSGVHLQPGQSLKVPASGAAPLQGKTADNKMPPQHTVKKGDSLDRIARKYKIKLSDLLQWNQLQADSKLTPGQQLLLAPKRRQS